MPEDLAKVDAGFDAIVADEAELDSCLARIRDTVPAPPLEEEIPETLRTGEKP